MPPGRPPRRADPRYEQLYWPQSASAGVLPLASDAQTRRKLTPHSATSRLRGSLALRYPTLPIHKLKAPSGSPAVLRPTTESRAYRARLRRLRSEDNLPDPPAPTPPATARGASRTRVRLARSAPAVRAGAATEVLSAGAPSADACDERDEQEGDDPGDWVDQPDWATATDARPWTAGTVGTAATGTTFFDTTSGAFRSTLVRLQVRAEELHGEFKTLEMLPPDFASQVFGLYEDILACSGPLHAPLQSLRALLHLLVFSQTDLTESPTPPFFGTLPYFASVTRMGAEIADLRAENSTLSSELALLRDNTTTVNAQVTHVESSVKTLSEALAVANQQLDELRETSATLDRDCKAAKTEEARYQSLYRNLLLDYEENVASTVKKEAKAFEAKIEQLSSEVTDTMLLLEESRRQMSSMVPATDLDSYKADSLRQKDQLDRLGRELERSQDLVERTQATLDKTRQEKDQMIRDLARELDYERAQRTPRPDWSEAPDILSRVNPTLGDTVPRGVKVSTRVFAEKLTRALLDTHDHLQDYKAAGKVLIERDNVARTNKLEFFKPLGTGPEVPRYLRTNNRIRNRHMSKRDAEVMIRDIWRDKLAYERKTKEVVSLAVYFHRYLSNRFGIQSMVADTAYNLIDACERFAFDPDCYLFLQILRSELSEDVHTEQDSLIEKLRVALQRVDVSEHGRETGKLARSLIMFTVKKLMPWKDESQLERIRGFLILDASAAQISYAALFSEDREHSQGGFVEEIRFQHIQETQESVKQVATAVDQLDADPSNPREFITVAEICDLIDPTGKTQPASLYSWISKCAGIPQGELMPTTSIEFTRFRVGLRANPLRRQSTSMRMHKTLQRGVTTLLSDIPEGSPESSRPSTRASSRDSPR